ncbi:hypothetical protein JCM3766R1_005453 [Sporobolomyces carnicolor]
MIAGIGVDLLHLARLRALLTRRGPHQLASRILSQPELLEWDQRREARSRSEIERFLALRWTAKEAAYKALYPRYELTWKDLVVSKRDKKPRLDFSPTFADKLGENAGDVRLHLSVSHDADLMVAYVVAEEA